jgi:penicillin-binding protein 2
MPRARTWIPRLGGGKLRINERRGPSLPNPLADPEEVGSRPDVRLWVVSAVFLALFGLVGVRLAFLQIVDHASYAASIVDDSVRTVAIPAPRGEIVDRNGLVLVANTLQQELVLSRETAQLDPGIVDRVAALVGETPKQITVALGSNQYTSLQPVPIDLSVPAHVVQYLEEHQSEFPGVSVETLTERTYPHGGALAPHVLGYVREISKAQLSQLASKGYTAHSIVGQTGIEAYYDSFLRGVDGTQRVEVDALGNPIATLSSTPPIPGDTVVLNVDANLQAFVTNALAADIYRVRHTYDPTFKGYPPAKNGAIVVLDPRNGHVLAMASYPTYNLDVWKGRLSTPAYDGLLGSGALNNFAIDGQYIPGSTFKLITATAALNDHLISPGTYVNDTGTFKVPGCLEISHGCVFHDDDNEALGEVDLPMALTASSDFYFYNLGYQFWDNWVNEGRAYPYGETPIQDVAAAYGLGGSTGIDLPNEASSIVDSPQVRIAEHHQDPSAYPYYQWYTGDNIELAFGQGGTVLTPIGLADAYATFANGGTRYEPEVAAGVLTPSGHVLQRYAPRIEGRVPLPASTYDPILQGLLGVVNNPAGTAYGAFHTYGDFNLANFPVAGKTGTATSQLGLEPSSWFVGFGPVPNPRYVVLCVIAQGGYGADAAAPVVAQTFGYLVAHPIGRLHLPKPASATTGH